MAILADVYLGAVLGLLFAAKHLFASPVPSTKALGFILVLTYLFLASSGDSVMRYLAIALSSAALYQICQRAESIVDQGVVKLKILWGMILEHYLDDVFCRNGLGDTFSFNFGKSKNEGRGDVSMPPPHQMPPAHQMPPTAAIRAYYDDGNLPYG